MCEACGDLNHEEPAGGIGRRQLLTSGIGMLAAVPLAGTALAMPAIAQEAVAENRLADHSVEGFGVEQGGDAVHRLDIQRRAAGPKDVVIETMFCGLCHSDIHIILVELGPVRGKTVPGHKIVGRVGSEATRCSSRACRPPAWLTRSAWRSTTASRRRISPNSSRI